MEIKVKMEFLAKERHLLTKPPFTIDKNTLEKKIRFLTYSSKRLKSVKNQK